MILLCCSSTPTTSSSLLSQQQQQQHHKRKQYPPPVPTQLHGWIRILLLFCIVVLVVALRTANNTVRSLSTVQHVRKNVATVNNNNSNQSSGNDSVQQQSVQSTRALIESNEDDKDDESTTVSSIDVVVGVTNNNAPPPEAAAAVVVEAPEAAAVVEATSLILPSNNNNDNDIASAAAAAEEELNAVTTTTTTTSSPTQSTPPPPPPRSPPSPRPTESPTSSAPTPKPTAAAVVDLSTPKENDNVVVEYDTTSHMMTTDLRTADDYPHYTRLSDFLQGPGLSFMSSEQQLTHAICQFRPIQYADLFPHAMQQLYRCTSWWFAHSHLPAIFVTGMDTNWAYHTNFVKGYMDMLQSSINVTIVSELNQISNDIPSTSSNLEQMIVESKDTGKWPTDIEITDFALHDPQRLLREYAITAVAKAKATAAAGQVDHTQYLPQQPLLPICPTSSSSNDSRLPRIAILNRENNGIRHLVHTVDMAQKIATAIDSTTTTSIPIVTFTYNTTFHEQMNFFLNTDIILTPHGAQMTGLAFVPECAVVLEFCPSRYLVPDYFGSLAAAIPTVQHNYIYLGNLDEVPHAERFHYLARMDNGHGDVNPNPDEVISAVQSMIQQWQSCGCTLEQQQQQSDPQQQQPSTTTTASIQQYDTTSPIMTTDLGNAEDYPHYTTPSDFLQGPGLSSDQQLTHAICQFRSIPWSGHFAHAMQQLYRCTSWWFANPQLPAVLVTGNWTAYETEFIKGYFILLRSSIDFTVITDLDEISNDVSSASLEQMIVESKDTGKWPDDIELTDFALHDPQRLLRDYAITALAKSRATAAGQDDYTQFLPQPLLPICPKSSSSNHRLPRIAILNRDETGVRHWVNAVDIAEKIATAVNAASSIPIVSFTYTTPFEEQMDFFLNHDIILTPHGAQMMGMPFVPECAVIMEFCVNRYLVADYFGSLAAAIPTVQHNYMYLGQIEEVPHAERFHYWRENDNKYGVVNPNPDEVIAAVQTMIQQWQTCGCTQEQNQQQQHNVMVSL